MPTQAFQFKQFLVQQDRCAMKVNTDGVLLGAWQYTGDSKTILDIGTGTGVIALMMAQGNANAQVEAIDIDEDAWQQAQQNFAKSPWANRLTAFHSSLQDFKPGKKYEVIISNPPYFVNDQQSDQHQKNIARHGVALNYSDLIAGIERLLTNMGKALLVIPAANFSQLEATASKAGLFVNAKCEVTAVTGKQAHVMLLQLGKVKTSPISTSITIQHSGDMFTDEYKALTADFYLNF